MEMMADQLWRSTWNALLISGGTNICGRSYILVCLLVGPGMLTVVRQNVVWVLNINVVP